MGYKESVSLRILVIIFDLRLTVFSGNNVWHVAGLNILSTICLKIIYKLHGWEIFQRRLCNAHRCIHEGMFSFQVVEYLE